MKRTPLLASLLLTAFASIGTSVVWNGLPFIGKQFYGFSETENYGLYLLAGVVYVIGALSSGKSTAIVNKYISTRTLIGILLLIQATVCALPLGFQGAWVIWCAAGVASFCSAWLWPLVESYVVAGRHGLEMRKAIGRWNLVWMVSVAGAMFSMAPFMKDHASMVIVGLGGAYVIAMFVLPWFGKNPGDHDIEQAIAAVPHGYKSLLKGARVLLPLSYILNGVLAPILPFVVSRLEVDIYWQTPLAAVWMFSRVLIVFAMWRIATWHGRWSVLWIAILAMGMGFGIVLLANSVSLLIIGLTVFGLGMGATYYAALYYAMAVGRAEVGAGGTHEALIGGGYMVGPIIGIGTIQFAGFGTTSSFLPLTSVVLAILILAVFVFAYIWKKDR